MEAANLLPQVSRSSSFTTPPSRLHKPPKFRIVAAVVTTPAVHNIATVRPAPVPDTKTGTMVTEKTVYNDSWFDRIAIGHLSQSLQSTTGIVKRKSSSAEYESLVDAAMAVATNFSPTQQHKLVIQALLKAFPRPILSMIRRLLPDSQFTREFFAAFTTVFFVWLVGPCEVKESELSGKTEKNVVHIKKCRFLEQTNCIGMCTNMCKMPSQTFIKDSFGIPVNMVPNFDDMSCEMIFGQEPPPPSEDPAFKEPCYKLCKANYKHNVKCFT